MIKKINNYVIAFSSFLLILLLTSCMVNNYFVLNEYMSSNEVNNGHYTEHTCDFHIKRSDESDEQYFNNVRDCLQYFHLSNSLNFICQGDPTKSVGENGNEYCGNGFLGGASNAEWHRAWDRYTNGIIQ